MTRPAHAAPWAGFPPDVLRQYALLADGERGILVGPRGEFAWMCAPQWESDAVFSLLVGGEGTYAVTPSERRFLWGGYYEDSSLIWHSRWVTTTGVIECREALAFPGDPHAAVVLRRVVATDGPARVRVLLDARAGFGAHKMGPLKVDDGVWTARSGGLHLRWSGGAGAKLVAGEGLKLDVELAAGAHHDLVLELSDQALGRDPVRAGPAWKATEAAWAAAMPRLDGTLAPRDVRHSYAVLRGLTSAGGGMVAAATMSLPERASAGRSYDYRYAWVRDQCYTGQAIAAHGPHPLLDDAVAFVAARIAADGSHLKPAYTVTGGPVPDERTLSHLDGYPGGNDKVGNWVNQQFQLDALGEALLLFAAAARHDHLDLEQWRAAEPPSRPSRPGGARRCRDLGARQPALGPLPADVRRRPAGHRRPGASAPGRRRGAHWLIPSWLSGRATALHPSGRWQRAPDDARVDAALLLPAHPWRRAGRRPAEPGHPRSGEGGPRSSSGYVYRFRQDQRPLEDAEGAFVLCGFLMALAYAPAGQGY